MIEVDGAERIGLGQYVADTVSMPGLHGGQRCRVIRPRAGIPRAGVALGLQRLKRRLLPFTVDFCVHRHTAHCGRSISGASARGSFVRSRWCVIGLPLLLSFPTAQPSLNGAATELHEHTAARRCSTSHHGISSSRSSVGLDFAAGFAGGSFSSAKSSSCATAVGFNGCGFGIGIARP